MRLVQQERAELAPSGGDALLDPGARNRAMRAAEQRLVELQAVIPMYFLIGRRLVSQRVLGWRDDNLTAFRPARWLSLR